MPDKINSIEELQNYNYKNSEYSGFAIRSTRSTYMLLVSNYQQCCEDWGYATTEDNLDEFIGADILSVDNTSSDLKSFNLDDYEYLEEEGSTMFLNFHTSKGKLQFVVYNAHNGYYSHRAILIKNKEIIEEHCL